MVTLGGILKTRISFHTPRAMSHARWLSKAIYAFQIYLFQDQVQLSLGEKNSLRGICIFVAWVYVQAWFLSSKVIKTMIMVFFLFMHQLINYQDINPEIGKAVVKNISIHLWCLTLKTLAVSIFDDNEVKANIALKLCWKQKGEEEEEEKKQLKRYILH